LGERHSSHPHTRRDSAVRDNPGSPSNASCTRCTNAGLNCCPQISTPAAYKTYTPRVQPKMWDTLSSDEEGWRYTRRGGAEPEMYKLEGRTLFGPTTSAEIFCSL
jgi:hypothetical protein